MERCTVLFVLQIGIIAVTGSGEHSVSAKLYQPVTLRCDYTCHGLVKWSRFHKTQVLALCDQTSCSSQQTGYEMSHDQYLQGDLALSITAADYSTRGLYTCQCDNRDVCDVRLLIETVETKHVVSPGEPIDVFLPLTDQVEVSFTATDSVKPSNLKICTVANEKIQSNPEYEDRVSRINIVQIKNGNVSDSGNYTVQDTLNDETIAIINVQVREKEPGLDRDQECGLAVWVLVLILVLVLVLVLPVTGFLFVMNMRLKKRLLSRSES